MQQQLSESDSLMLIRIFQHFSLLSKDLFSTMTTTTRKGGGGICLTLILLRIQLFE